MPEEIPVSGDRMCRRSGLDNPLRRWLAPAVRGLETLDIRPGHRVADLGAGVGYFAPEVLRRVGTDGRLDLVDIDAANLEIARRRVGGDPRARILVRTAADLGPIEDSTVDRVLLSLVLCCLADKAGALDEAWRILRPGGLALVTYPRVRCPLIRRRRSLRVTKGVWSSLLSRHRWRLMADPGGLLVRRYLLQKPEEIERRSK